MMKHILRNLAMVATAVMSAVSFTSCDNGDEDFWWGPDNGNRYHDNNLFGTWQLIEANGHDVPLNETNYLEFFNSGRGYYFYYTDGRQTTQRITWVCNAGNYRDSITIRYQDGRQSTMNYRLTDNANYLYLQWYDVSGYQYTYIYHYIGNTSPW